MGKLAKAEKSAIWALDDVLLLREDADRGGQVIRGEHATAAVDEAIIGAFDQWDQYEAQLSAAEDATSQPALPGTHRRAEGRSQ